MERGELERNIKQLSARLKAGARSPSAEDVDHGLCLLEQVDTYLTRSVFGSDKADPEQNIVVLGTTGAGKSTVASFLFGRGNVVVHHKSPYTRALVAEPPLADVIIRGGPTSATLLPVVNHFRLGDRKVAVWDMPGSRDTRGPFVELLVHFIFQWMLKDKDLRFVIVTPPPHERPQTVTLQGLINGSLIRADNAVVVYTKCGTNFDPDITNDLDIEEGKRGIRSFALPAPVKSDPEGHRYSLQYHERKLEILKALEGLRSYAVNFDESLPAAAARLLDRIYECCVGFARDVLSACCMPGVLILGRLKRLKVLLLLSKPLTRCLLCQLWIFCFILFPLKAIAFDPTPKLSGLLDDCPLLERLPVPTTAGMWPSG